VNIFQSSVNNNTGDGIFGNGLTGSGLVLMIEGSNVSNNNVGIHSNGSSSIQVANSSIIGNAGLGVSSTNSGQLITFVSNRLVQNGSPGTFVGPNGTNQ
jgi:hypothetical protein